MSAWLLKASKDAVAYMEGRIQGRLPRGQYDEIGTARTLADAIREEERLYATPLDCTLRNLEDLINDLSAAYLNPELTPEQKAHIKAHSETLRGFCALLEQ